MPSSTPLLSLSVELAAVRRRNSTPLGMPSPSESASASLALALRPWAFSTSSGMLSPSESGSFVKPLLWNLSPEPAPLAELPRAVGAAHGRGAAVIGAVAGRGTGAGRGAAATGRGGQQGQRGGRAAHGRAGGDGGGGAGAVRAAARRAAVGRGRHGDRLAARARERLRPVVPADERDGDGADAQHAGDEPGRDRPREPEVAAGGRGGADRCIGQSCQSPRAGDDSALSPKMIRPFREIVSVWTKVRSAKKSDLPKERKRPETRAARGVATSRPAGSNLPHLAARRQPVWTP